MRLMSKQNKNIIEALKAAAPEWTFEQINFVAGRWCAVVEDDFYNKLERLSVQAGKRDKVLASHVQRICEAHDTVLRSYYQQLRNAILLSANMGRHRLGLTRWCRWRTLENTFMCKWLTILLSSAAEERWRRDKAWLRWANQRRYTQKAQHRYQNGWIFLILPENILR